MKTIIVVGGSKGIGNAIVKLLLHSHKVINISRTKPEITHENLEHFSCDVISDEALTYKQSTQLKLWRLDYISLAEDPPHPIIE